MNLDLVVLVPDKDIEQSIEGILRRHPALGIRPIKSHKIIVHPNRDPGTYNTGHKFLQYYANTAEHGLVIFDRSWDGAPQKTAEQLAADVVERCRSSWGDRAACVCIDPEIENWVWSDSSAIAEPLGWDDRTTLVTWLQGKGLWPVGAPKPPDPKRAFEAATRYRKVVPSSAIFRRLADKVAVGRCQDPSFIELCRILRQWFPPA